MTLVQNIKTFIKSHSIQGTKANWGLFVLFSLTIFVKIVLFHWFAFHSILISSLWENPLIFWSFYLPKISISIFIASFIFIIRNRKWTVCLLLLIDIWCLAELVYYRVFGVFFDKFTMTMTGNLDGFWSSIPMYFTSTDVCFFLITSAYYVIVLFFKHDKRNYLSFILAITLSILLTMLACNLLRKKHTNAFNPDIAKVSFHPFTEYTKIVLGYEYISCFSVVHELINIPKEMLFSKTETYEVTSSEKEEIDKFINNNQNVVIPKQGLVIIIVESLESWCIHPKVMPNLYRFSTKNDNVLHATSVIAQRRGGGSADGQMIINTGLLPIQQGATCYRYPINKFPSLTSLYTSNIGVFPHLLSVWNQGAMNIAYEINNSKVVSPDDFTLFKEILEGAHSYDAVLSLTVSTHSPFLTYSDSVDLIEYESISTHLDNYVKSMSYVDKNMSIILNSVLADTILQQKTIVITGDHTAFSSNMRNDYTSLCKQKNINYAIEGNYCPLIIYSPNINDNIQITDVCYQMDIYPTILHLIGCEDYYWKGFGVNLLDSTARYNRPITEEQAYQLSDKMIRANYFKDLQQIQD